MILQIMAVYDAKARAYIHPFYSAHLDVAVRVFAECANTPDHQIGKFPEDFHLYHLGTWDDSTAKMELLNEPRVLGCAIMWTKQRPIPGTSGDQNVR